MNQNNCCEECQFYGLTAHREQKGEGHHHLESPRLVAPIVAAVCEKMDKNKETSSPTKTNHQSRPSFTILNNPSYPQPRMYPLYRVPVVTSGPSMVHPSVTPVRSSRTTWSMYPGKNLDQPKLIKLNPNHLKMANEPFLPPSIGPEVTTATTGSNNAGSTVDFVTVQKRPKMDIKKQSWLEDEILTVLQPPTSGTPQNGQKDDEDADDGLVQNNLCFERAAPVAAAGAMVKKFDCPLKCGRSYTREDTLIRHMREHRGERPYPCAFNCGKSFSRTDHRLVHERSQHRGFTCGHCQETFSSISMAEIHVLNMHPYNGAGVDWRGN